MTRAVVFSLVLPLVFAIAAGPAKANPPQDGDALAAQQRFAEQQQTLSQLWVFATLNYLYCDVIGLMDANMLKQYEAGKVGDLKIDENFLLGATIMMQIPMSMVFLSTALPPRASRIANIVAGTLMTGIQTSTLFVGEPSKYYVFSSAVEIATTGFITAYALFAMKPPPLVPTVSAQSDQTSVSVRLRF